MTSTNSLIRVWEAPQPDEVGADPHEFLHRLGGPTWLIVPGEDRSRVRAITTLLHGNEPSGLRALHRWLLTGVRPAVDIVCGIPSVPAALTPPGFAHRRLPGHRDLNRCFRPPYDGLEGRLAAGLLAKLRDSKPEALIDIHNTSGLGPAYGASTRIDTERIAVTSFFSEHLVITDVRVGALMEATEDDFPTVTIECGGIRNRAADIIALEGLARYVSAPQLFARSAEQRITILKHPIRVRAVNGAEVAYSNAPISGVDITLRQDIDRFNYTVLPPSEPLGWLGTRGMTVIRAYEHDAVNLAYDLFALRDGRLYATRPVRLFMATTDPLIAKDDCLFYAILADE